jgi:hypothetical protein
MNEEVKDKIFKIIEDCYSLSDEIREWISSNKQVYDFFNSSLQEIYKLLQPVGSFEYRKFDSWKQKWYLWQWRVMPWSANSDTQIMDLISILQEISGYKKPDSEVHFNANDEFKARQYFRKLFQSAKNEIFIIDNYLSSLVFEFLEDIGEDINIRFLAWKEWVKSWFKNDFLAWKRKNIECRLHVSTNHDRYIVIDKSELYHPWASLNGIWKNDFSVKKLELKEKMDDLEKLWNNSEELKK